MQPWPSTWVSSRSTAPSGRGCGREDLRRARRGHADHGGSHMRTTASPPIAVAAAAALTLAACGSVVVDDRHLAARPGALDAAASTPAAAGHDRRGRRLQPRLLDAGRRGRGRRSRRHPERHRTVHRVRAHQRGVRRAARRPARQAAPARQQGRRSTKILTYHVVAAKVHGRRRRRRARSPPSRAATSPSPPTAASRSTTPPSPPTDVEASNGVIHVIDAVLVPADVDVASSDPTSPRTAEARSPPGAGLAHVAARSAGDVGQHRRGVRDRVALLELHSWP